MKTSALVLALVLTTSDAWSFLRTTRASSTAVNMLSGGAAHLKSLENVPPPTRTIGENSYSPAPFATAESNLVHPASRSDMVLASGAAPSVTFGGPQNGGIEGSSILPQQYQQVDAENPYGSNSHFSRGGYAPGLGGQTRAPRMRSPILPRVPPIQGDQIMTTGGIEGSKKVWSVYQGPNGST